MSSRMGSTSTMNLLGISRRDSFRVNGAIKKEKEVRLTFQELKSLERHRREILLRAELPFWRILLFWSGTCLKEITEDLLVWTTVAIYACIRIYAHSIDYVPDSVELLEKTNVGVLGGFLSFFLVLFVNQTNSRFLEMYGFSKACSGRIQDVAGLARTQLPSEVADRLVRHFNAAQVAGYVGLNAIGQGSPYSKEHFFDVYNKKHHLLNPEEMEMLDHHDMDNSGLCMKELCTWCQEDVAEARKTGYLDSYQEKFMHDRILAFRAAMDGMYDYTDQPPHFFYIHFLVLLSALYLPLFAIDTGYSAGWGDDTYIGLDFLNGVIVFLQCIFVVGLRSLGTKMIDPYGDDLEDLSVILYVESTLEICDTIMNSKRAGMKMDTLPAVYKPRSWAKEAFPSLSDENHESNTVLIASDEEKGASGILASGDVPPAIQQVQDWAKDALLSVSEDDHEGSTVLIASDEEKGASGIWTSGDTQPAVQQVQGSAKEVLPSLSEDDNEGSTVLIESDEEKGAPGIWTSGDTLPAVHKVQGSAKEVLPSLSEDDHEGNTVLIESDEEKGASGICTSGKSDGL